MQVTGSSGQTSFVVPSMCEGQQRGGWSKLRKVRTASHSALDHVA